MNILMKSQNNPLPDVYVLSHLSWDHPCKPENITFGARSIEEALEIINGHIKLLVAQKEKKHFSILIET